MASPKQFLYLTINVGKFCPELNYWQTINLEGGKDHHQELNQTHIRIKIFITVYALLCSKQI